MRTASRLALRAPYFVQAVQFTQSVRPWKGHKNRVNPGVVKPQTIRGDGQSSSNPYPAKGQTAEARTTGRDPDKTFRSTILAFLQYHRKYIIYWAVGSTAWYLFVGICYFRDYETVPITGRGRFNGPRVLSKQYEREQSTETSSEVPDLPHDVQMAFRTERVRAVLQRVTFAAGLEEVQWKIRILDSPTPTAAVSANGDVFITSGTLGFTLSHSHLACLLGHEVPHYLAGHTKESAKVKILALALALPLAPAIISGGILGALGMFLGEGLLLIPAVLLVSPLGVGNAYSFYTSRKRAHEADTIGLYLAAAAGYDINAAVDNLKAVGDYEEVLVNELRRQRPDFEPTSSGRYPSTPERIHRVRCLIPIVKTAIEHSSADTLPWAPRTRFQTDCIRHWAEFVKQRDERRASTAAQKTIEPAHA